MLACGVMIRARSNDVVRWARGQRLAQRRIAREARLESLGLEQSLDRVDDLRELAKSLAPKSQAESERENLAFHLTWRSVRRAFGLG